MRLIKSETAALEEFFANNIPKYAILSHWWEEEEVTITDLTENLVAGTLKKGYQKVWYACSQALEDGLKYAWVDTCCVDKRSSAKLSEAII